MAELNKLLQSEKCIELSQSVESITTFEVPIVGKRISVAFDIAVYSCYTKPIKQRRRKAVASTHLGY